MSMTVRKRKDSPTPRVFMHKVADIRGGVAVKTSELGGDYLPEGAVLSAPDNGICHVVKFAVVASKVEAEATTIQVKKMHNFKVGDYVMTDGGSVAYAITAIDTSAKGYDTITVGTTLGAISAGGYIVEAAGEASKDAAMKYTPLALVGTGKPVLPDTNLDTDAWVIGVTHNNPLPDCIAEHLKGIINY